MEANRLSIKDLMVGDWIKIKTYKVSDKFERTEAHIYVKIAEIGSDLVTVDYNNDIKEPYRICENTKIEPIPLTPEILEKNGMHLYNRKTNSLMEECNHYDCFEEDEDYRVELSLDYDGKIRWTINGDEYTIMPLDYVHQLQHALKLCDVPKEITL